MLRVLKRQGDWLSLGVMWLLAAGSDRLWLTLDQSPPAWDQADYLTQALTYWQALQQGQWLSPNWWHDLWLLSTKIPPLTFIAAVPLLNGFGPGADQTILVQLLFSAVLMLSAYGLGKQLFTHQIGVWAAGLCLLLPGLYHYRLQFLLDYPLAAMVTLCFFCLTGWRQSWLASKHSTSAWWGGWPWAIAFGVTLGLALLIKQPALLFLGIPILWLGVRVLWQRAWGYLLQLGLALGLSSIIWFPWYRTNWLLILTAGKRATLDAAVLEGDPPLQSWAAWTYYWHELPNLISWPLLVIPLAGILLYRGLSWFVNLRAAELGRERPIWGWLLLFLVGAYGLASLNVNKDARYILPCLPVLALILADGLNQLQDWWGQRLRWGVAGLGVFLMALNLYPLGGFAQAITGTLSPQAQTYTNWWNTWPHQQVIDAMITAMPYRRLTLGVLPSTSELNQHNFNYYGALANFQVYGRQVGVEPDQVSQDGRSLPWYLVKTGEQGSLRTEARQEAQSALVQEVETSPDFILARDWSLPDEDTLKLYRRRQPLIEVQTTAPVSQIRLERVEVPQSFPPGAPVPVTYEWSGPWEELRAGLVLLTYQATRPNSTRWFHDHAIGLGTLYTPEILPAPGFQVLEKTAMLPPANLRPGTYQLSTIYLNRETGATYPLATPPVFVTLDSEASAAPAPELDWITQLRQLATLLPRGPETFEQLFREIARINQYDPVQDYVVQAAQALTYRLQREPNNLDFGYNLALAEILQQDVQGAIATLKQVVALDPENPYANAYLAFVYLYDWQPRLAQPYLQQAQSLAPNDTTIQSLDGVAALMQGNLVKAWQDLRSPD